MEYQLQDLSEVKKKVTVTVPTEEVNAALGAAIALYRKDTQIDGFRKGKVPGSVIEQRFKKQIYHEATTDLVNLHINEIMGQAKLQPVSGIDFDGKELVRDEDFSYSFTFEVLPEVTVPAYEGIEVEEEEAVVDPSEVEQVIDRIRNNLAEFDAVSDNRNPVDGDVVNVSFAAFDGETPIEGIKAENFQLVLGQGQSLEQFEEIVKKMQVDTSTQEDISFPADFLNEALAGKTVTMKVKLHAIKVRKLPALDDDLAQKAGGFPSMEKMREAIVASYSQGRQQLNRSVAQKALLEIVLKDVDFPLPGSMVEEHQHRMLADLRRKVEQKGKNLEAFGKTEAEYLEQFKPEAENLVRTQVLLLAVAKREAFEVTDQELDLFFAEQAAQSGENPNDIKRYYMENNLMFSVRDKLLADKAMDLIYSKAKVTMVQAKKEDAAPAAE